MIHLSIPVIIEFFVGLFLWWIAVFLITQNPFDRIVQLLSIFFVSISLYLTTDVFFYLAIASHQNVLYGHLLKDFIWTIYLPMAVLYHLSLLLTPKSDRGKWQKVVLYLVYFITLSIIIIETQTNLTRNYSSIYDPSFSGNLATVTGKYFWVIGVFFWFIFIFTTTNFYLLFKKHPKYSINWHKYFWPFLGLFFALLIAPWIILSYYNILPHSETLDAFAMLLISGPLVYSIIKFGLLIEEAKIFFGKTFLYSTLSILLILALYFIIFYFTGIKNFFTYRDLIFPFIFLYLIILSHPTYDWLTTFARDIFYNLPSGISVVTDAEIGNAIRNYNNPDQLENSALLRLNLISDTGLNDKHKTPVDSLKNAIHNSIEYFKPEENRGRRTKQNLKYHLLRMIAFDQAEEGQILWELGFEEYPFRIMSKESQARPPFFKTSSPSDYNYVSRNAYMALKKEAIHNIAWRISYLEKMSKKKI